LRKSLYVKTDDYKLSFLKGAYITATNLKEKDIVSIIENNLSPLHIAVNATDHALRLKLLGLKKTSNLLDILKRLTSNGVELHCKIILIPNVTDGENLKNTLWDLRALGENVKSVAIVPVYITKYRKNPFPIVPVSKTDALEAIKIAEEFYEGTPFFAFCSDEVYDMAGMQFKKIPYYGDFAQLESGVGVNALFIEGIENGIAKEEASVPKYKKIAVLTGGTSFKAFQQAKIKLEQIWDDFKMDVLLIKNEFLGGNTNETKYVAGRDILEQAESLNMPSYEMVYLPDCMLDEHEDVFIDNVTAKQVQKMLGCKVTIVSFDGECFVDAIAGI
jgi:putative radical SAM enzyme (TIGR03279 family)